MQRREENRTRLLEGPIGLTLLRLTVPMIAAVMAMVAFNLTDTFFVGRLGTASLAAMSFTFPIVFIVNSLTMGIGMGVSAVVSRAIGAGDEEQVRRLTTDSLLLAVIMVAILATIGLLTIRPVFTLLGARAEILELVRGYISIWFAGVIFVVIPMVGNSAIRATGDTKTPSLIMITAVAVNIVLDPLLIFGIGPFPRLELAGAAAATVAARAVTMVVSLRILIRREHMISFRRPRLQEVLASWKSVLYIGLPTAATHMVIPLGIGIITRLVAGYGPAAVAAYGVGGRIDPIAMGTIMALGSALGPFVGQNLGAGQIPRVWTAVRYSHAFSLVWGALAFGLLAIFARPLADVFSNDPEVVSIVTRYLHIMPLGYGFWGISMLSNTTLNVLHRPWHASGVTVFYIFGLYIPLALLGSHLIGLHGIFWGGASAALGGGTIAYVVLRRVVLAECREACIEPVA